MKRFLVFTGSNYYPNGGMGDFKNDYNSLEEALKGAIGYNDDWVQIYDCEERKIVFLK